MNARVADVRPEVWEVANAQAFAQCGAPASPAQITPAATGQAIPDDRPATRNRPGMN